MNSDLRVLLVDINVNILGIYPRSKKCDSVNKRLNGIHICIFQLLRRKFLTAIFCTANLTACQLERLYASGRPSQFQPECTVNGKYKTVQCERGICWCVDQYGNELYGTKTYGTPQSSCPDKSTPGILNVLFGVWNTHLIIT